ncbi:DNA repair protein RecN [Eggerthia catenaformis OT 569 = DSM 20559]|uniref:DNA repair protein RecN n=1 Tax=Eggerthia catenaformis OT 569 = DSM 20559 TaxID=999415 RepID=M2Q442_9FIRM|nr:DNA repair protein RecN [Eggerthia catenaformis]EMD17001.1 DNA repair protein RecN [Eggerthia catenaformis OT 569 = DSM 20559]OUC51908.1 DNA repair protein RecN [Eggerthia catenaformis]
MLNSLYISSFVIIDKMQIDFHDHMSVLTGETGAGKSIIIDAIGQLTGNRASNTMVRKGKDKAIIEGVFYLEKSTELLAIFNSINIDFDNETIITKEIYENGKSHIKINYRNATNNALKLLAPYLIHIHSQFETQSLFSADKHLSILDQYAKISQDMIDDYQSSYNNYKKIESKLKMISEEEMSDEAIEYYQSQYNEIKDFSYTDEDIEEIENELNLMKNYEKMNLHINEFDRLFNGSHGGVLEYLSDAIDELNQLKDFNVFSDSYDHLYNEYYNLKDIYSEIMNHYHSFSFDEYRFNELQEELFKIQKIQRKYGYSIEKIIAAKENLKEKIELSMNRESIIAELYKKKNLLYNQAIEKAKKLHYLRKDAAIEFEKEIKNQLEDLYMPQALLKVHFDKSSLNKSGTDKIIFMAAMNRGSAFIPISESASGGEMSRMMLAIKTITFVDNVTDTIIFDEVDTGVSGKAADAIGAKMEQLSAFKQVICITHLPQVAVHAKHHYSIIKESDNAETYSSIKELNNQERVAEIAKMLSSNVITNEAINNAKALLQQKKDL